MAVVTKTCPTCFGVGRIPTDKTLGERLRVARQQAGVTLDSIAVALGISKSYCSQLENGWRSLSDGMFDTYLSAIEQNSMKKGKIK